jgi:hypothetical protein
VPSRTRLLFVDPAVAPDIGAVHQGPVALVALYQWAERCVGLKIPRAPGTLVERARFYWNRVPPALRKRAQLYIIRERRDTPWRFSDANPWRRGLRPVSENKLKKAVDWGGFKPKTSTPLWKTEPISAGQSSAGEELGYAPPKRKKNVAPTTHTQTQPKERLKVGIWS